MIRSYNSEHLIFAKVAIEEVVRKVNVLYFYSILYFSLL